MNTATDQTFAYSVEQILLSSLQSIAVEPKAIMVDHVFVWERCSVNGNRTGSGKLLRTLHPAYSFYADFDVNSSKMTDVLAQYYPEYLGLVGNACCRERRDGRSSLCGLIEEYWHRFQTLVGDVIHATAVVHDFEDFLVARRQRRSIIAPLLNFRSEVDAIEVGVAGLVLRPLTDAEYSRLYGGSMSDMLWREGSIFRSTDFALVGDFDEAINFGEDTSGTVDATRTYQASLDAAILALRTFKPKPIGIGGIHVQRSPFSVGGLPIPSYPEYVPRGEYLFTSDDLPRFRAHLDRMSPGMHPSLRTACRRLSDAAIRTDSADRLMDAVIGLEAILLYGSNEGETTFRFALNYSTFFVGNEQKMTAFTQAERVYRGRCKVAHGTDTANGKVRINDRQVDLSELAEQAVEILRLLVDKLLPSASFPPYVADRNYYRNAILGAQPANKTVRDTECVQEECS